MSRATRFSLPRIADAQTRTHRPRQPKLRRSFNITAHAHALTFTCHRRLPLLSKDRTRGWFLESLNAARTKWNFEVWAYVLMPEHVHALIFPLEPDYDIALILKRIKQPVARRATNFLRKDAPDFLDQLRVEWPGGRVEHRFWEQGGGFDRNIVNPNAVRATADYFHLNPVRRGLVNVATEWLWSSARYYAGMDSVPFRVDESDFS